MSVVFSFSCHYKHGVCASENSDISKVCVHQRIQVLAGVCASENSGAGIVCASEYTLVLYYYSMLCGDWYLHVCASIREFWYQQGIRASENSTWCVYQRTLMVCVHQRTLVLAWCVCIRGLWYLCVYQNSGYVCIRKFRC